MKSPLPKLAKDFAALVGIARKEASPAVIEAALTDAHGQVVAATAEREAAEASYRDGLLDASPTESERQLAAASAAKVKVDRAEALIFALTQRLGTAREAEAHANRKAVYDGAVAKCEAIKARFAREYVHYASALRELLRDLAEAETARAHAEKVALNIGYIEPPEAALRNLNGRPEEIIEETTVELWAVDGRFEPLPADQQRSVRIYADRPNRGHLSIPSSGQFSSGGGLDCTKRPFRKVTYRPGENASSTESLFRTLTLPPVEEGAGEFYAPSRWQDAEGALAALSGEVNQAPKRDAERPVSVRWEQVTTPDPALRGAA